LFGRVYSAKNVARSIVLALNLLSFLAVVGLFLVTIKWKFHPPARINFYFSQFSIKFFPLFQSPRHKIIEKREEEDRMLEVSAAAEWAGKTLMLKMMTEAWKGERKRWKREAGWCRCGVINFEF
jgi:hypothetical protein